MCKTLCAVGPCLGLTRRTRSQTNSHSFDICANTGRSREPRVTSNTRHGTNACLQRLDRTRKAKSRAQKSKDALCARGLRLRDHHHIVIVQLKFISVKHTRGMCQIKAEKDRVMGQGARTTARLLGITAQHQYAFGISARICHPAHKSNRTQCRDTVCIKSQNFFPSTRTQGNEAARISLDEDTIPPCRTESCRG